MYFTPRNVNILIQWLYKFAQKRLNKKPNYMLITNMTDVKNEKCIAQHLALGLKECFQQIYTG
jgi:hypothetical protein